jgi:excisionase family DNA binding protein
MVKRKFLSPQDVADALGVHPATVRRWIQSGKLKAIQPGGPYKIREEDFEEFLRAFEVDPKALPLPRDERMAEELLAWGATFPRERESSAFIIVGRVVDGRYRMCVLWNVEPSERERLRPKVRRLAGDDFIERELHSEEGQKLLAAAAG